MLFLINTYVTLVTDKIKTIIMALSLSAIVTFLIGVAWLTHVAKSHQSSLRIIATYMKENLHQTRVWPDDLFLATFSVPMIFFLMSFSLLLFMWRMRWDKGARNLRGVYERSDLIEKSAQSSPRIFAGKFGHHTLYTSLEDRALVIGPPGTGKTAFLLNQLLQACEEKLSFVIVDFKPEIFGIIGQKLKDKGYKVLRIDPTSIDIDADHWNPLLEVNSEAAVTEICAALLPVRDPRDVPFVAAQRDWLQAVVFHIKEENGSLPDAYRLMTQFDNPQKLLDLLMQSKSESGARIARSINSAMSGQKPDPLIGQGLAQAARSLRFLALPSVVDALGRSDITIKDLGKDERPTAFFIQFKETEAETFAPVLTLLTSRVISSLIETAGKRKPVAIFLDELGAMPPIPGLATKLNTIRSRHMPVWMYFQAVEQLERQYGKGASDLFFTSADLRMCFALNDISTREMFSKLVGTTEREKKTKSRNSSTKGGRTTSRSVTKSRENVIESHEIGDLKTGEVLCLYKNGTGAIGEATPHYETYREFRR